MSDRHAGYVVVLQSDLRDDDAQATIAAIQQIKGVLTVTPIVSNVETMLAEQRARHRIASKLIDIARKEIEL